MVPGSARNRIAANQKSSSQETNMKTNIQSHDSPLQFRTERNIRLIIITGLAVCITLCGTPGTARGEQLFASVNGTTQDGGGSIVQYAPDGTASTFASGLSRPRGLVFDSAGNLFVSTNTGANFGNSQGTILKFTPDGVMSTFATGFSPGRDFLEGLALDSAGNLFVVAINNAGNDPAFPTTIYKVPPGGTVSPTPFGLQSDCIESDGSHCSTPGQAFGLAFDSAGYLYVEDNLENTIYKFNPAGVRSTSIGPEAFTSPQFPICLAFDNAGNLFVSTSDGNNPTTGAILKFTPNADGLTWTKTTPDFATGLSANPRGLAFDSAGNLFVADIPGITTGNILEFTPAGALYQPTPTGTPGVFASGIGRPQGNGGPEFLAFTARAVTPVGSNVPVNIGAVGSAVVALTFPQVTVAGTTTVTPIDPSSAGTLPSGYELTGGNLAFQITTTATYTTPPPIIIAFQVPSVDAATFSQLRVLHNEGGTLVDRTASNPAPNPTTKTIYASVSSLSPFVIAKLRIPTDKNQCKNGGWQTFVRANGTRFKNQGDCIQYVNTGK
jgi:sugar lactone lactonase YvrE